MATLTDVGLSFMVPSLVANSLATSSIRGTRRDGTLTDMNRKPEHGLFITGTDTDVGKTYIAAAIARCLVQQGCRVGVYKPVASGCDERDGRRVATDAEQLWQAAGSPLTVDDVCPQKFLAPLAPHVAAREEGCEVDPERLIEGIEAWADFDFVLVEGAGGLMSPLHDELYVADVAEAMGYPLVVVAANRIGVINQTLQTLIAAATFRDGLSVAGVILNDVTEQDGDESQHTNEDELVARSVPPLLARVAHGDPSALTAIDWQRLARLELP